LSFSVSCSMDFFVTMGWNTTHINGGCSTLTQFFMCTCDKFKYIACPVLALCYSHCFICFPESTYIHVKYICISLCSCGCPKSAHWKGTNCNSFQNIECMAA
jgi:hypothetical protein